MPRWPKPDAGCNDMPSAAEIAERTALIREKWSPKERERRLRADWREQTPVPPMFFDEVDPFDQFTNEVR